MDISDSKENRNDLDGKIKDNIEIHPQDAHVNTVGNMNASDGENKSEYNEDSEDSAQDENEDESEEDEEEKGGNEYVDEALKYDINFINYNQVPTSQLIKAQINNGFENAHLVNNIIQNSINNPNIKNNNDINNQLQNIQKAHKIQIDTQNKNLREIGILQNKKEKIEEQYQIKMKKLLNIQANRLESFEQDIHNPDNKINYDDYLIKLIYTLRRLHIQSFREFRCLYNMYYQYRITVDGLKVAPGDPKLMKHEFFDFDNSFFYKYLFNYKLQNDINNSKNINNNNNNNSNENFINSNNSRDTTTTTTNQYKRFKTDNDIFCDKFLNSISSNEINFADSSSFTKRETHLLKMLKQSEKDKSKKEKIIDELQRDVTFYSETLITNNIKKNKKILELKEIILKKESEIGTLQNKFDSIREYFSKVREIYESEQNEAIAQIFHSDTQSMNLKSSTEYHDEAKKERDNVTIESLKKENQLLLEKVNQIGLKNSQLEKEKEKLLSYHQEKDLKYKESPQILQDPNNETGSQNL
ncbi:hypothetical protein DICPUDRAFT_150465 [Dictyostelium purpureum]|uniref:Uncharacterized protein n=1 Tax=Dictyostelium purpureum TaxID=5786 RepID=F0ZGE4_DICPU|nr:uncharacterized protein DICPUDRAFT_150465 [Dictyostelium purpureum]EGC36995.1 hypothetical protein DICPUDRAFT_150465 [Dictyostelium purpureum]|eukprot:XP_003286492.1 hypothetical protein DICPUDRAFT_150465 [Dictyostelium purpureum]